MHKKLAIIIALILAVVLLFPIPMYLKDGGTVCYKALLYEIQYVHRLNALDESTYDNGIIIKVLGFEVFENINHEKHCE